MRARARDKSHKFYHHLRGEKKGLYFPSFTPFRTVYRPGHLPLYAISLRTETTQWYCVVM